MSFTLESFDFEQDSEVDSRSSLYVFDSFRDSINSFRIDSLNSAEFLTSYKNTVFLNACGQEPETPTELSSIFRGRVTTNQRSQALNFDLKFQRNSLNLYYLLLLHAIFQRYKCILRPGIYPIPCKSCS